MTSEGKVYFGSQCQRLHLPCSKGKASVSRQKEHEPELLISQTNQEVRCGGGGGQEQDVILLQRSTPNGQLLPAGSTCQKPWRANTPQSVTTWRPRAETMNLQGTSQIPTATALSHLVCLIWCVWSCGVLILSLLLPLFGARALLWNTAWPRTHNPSASCLKVLES